MEKIYLKKSIREIKESLYISLFFIILLSLSCKTIDRDISDYYIMISVDRPSTTEDIDNSVTNNIVGIMHGLGMKNIYAYSLNGISNVILQFPQTVNDSQIRQLILNKFIENSSRFPEKMKPPVVTHYSSSEIPVILLGINSRLDPFSTRQFIDKEVQMEFSDIKGIAQGVVINNYNTVIDVMINLKMANNYNVSEFDIIHKVKEFKAKSDSNTLYDVNISDNVNGTVDRISCRVQSLEELWDITISGSSNNEIIKLNDVAQLRFTTMLSSNFSINGNRYPGIIIKKLKHEDSVRLQTKIHETVMNIEHKYPFIKFVTMN